MDPVEWKRFQWVAYPVYPQLVLPFLTVFAVSTNDSDFGNLDPNKEDSITIGNKEMYYLGKQKWYGLNNFRNKFVHALQVLNKNQIE